MTAPSEMRVNPDLLRGLGSSWHRLADSMDSLDPGGFVATETECVRGSVTSGVMAGAPELLNVGVTRTSSRFREMAAAARRAADATESEDRSFAETLGRIDSGR